MELRIGKDAVSGNERDTMQVEYVAERIAEGLPFGTGDIDGVAIAEAAGPEVMTAVDKLIMSPEILVDVSTDSDGHMIDDDGCGDGRITDFIKRGRDKLVNVVNKHRAKVFGGGSAMTMADMVGSGEATGPLRGVFSKAINTLLKEQINFGAHTGITQDTNSCGCGAVDKSPAAIVAVGTNAEGIRGVFSLLTQKFSSAKSDQPKTGIDALLATDYSMEITDNFRRYGETIKGQEFHGMDVMNEIADWGKIIKELEGGHLEARILLNLVRGKTVDQGLVHKVSGGKADVFAVDVWRLQDLAERLHPENVTAQQRAFQSMLAYTLGVAAVLTSGKLPVYVIKPVEEPAHKAEHEPALAAL